jgi:murein L,D-transpeptidase YcbB/YkuD
VLLETKVIVGRALETRTPLISEELRFIEFSPYWNVPPSIAIKELVPRLRRDPAYWTREGFEFVLWGGQVATDLSADRLDAVLRGEARIRQRPGPANALGDIKFVFPNNDSIYLHHTPSVALFGRERRDFSHGCIRVEDPVALARFVLRDQPEWTEERIRAAMAEGTSRTLRVAQPVPVLVAYATALVVGGRPHFFPDLYGHDRLLAQALRARTASAVIRAHPPPDSAASR